MSEKRSAVRWSGAVADSTVLQGAITSAGVCGALIGSILVFHVTERLGTRREMLVAAVLFALGAAAEWLGGAPNSPAASGLTVLIAGRCIYGVGCGFAMHGAPSYIAELAPPAIRGALVSLKEGMIVLGMLLGYVVGYLYSGVSGGWRVTYLASVLPAVVMFLGVLRLPAPPRWLTRRRSGKGETGGLGGICCDICGSSGSNDFDDDNNNKNDDGDDGAMDALRFVYPDASKAELAPMLEEMVVGREQQQRRPSQRTVEEGGGSSSSYGGEARDDGASPARSAAVICSSGDDYADHADDAAGASAADDRGGSGGGGLREIFSPANRRALVAGLGVVTLQQVTGQPSILYYASSIFAEAGMASYAAVLTGSFKLVMTLLSVVVVDKHGRRWLLFVGVGIMLFALAVMVAAFWGDTGEGGLNFRTAAIIIGMFLYIGGYQVSFGPIAWLLISEIFPLGVRDQAISVAVFTNFAWNVLVSFSYPVVIDAFAGLVGEHYKLSAAFSIFFALTLYSLHFINKHVPETKGLSLEQIEEFLKG